MGNLLMSNQRLMIQRGLNSRCLLISGLLAIISLFVGSAAAEQDPSAAADEVAPDPAAIPDAPETPALQAEQEQLERWQYFVPLKLPTATTGVAAEGGAGLVELELDSSVFSHARDDLADLRLLDSQSRAVPYALRYLTARSIQDKIATRQFDRSESDGGPTELTLELLSDGVEHNELRVLTDGSDFRRSLLVEVSDDRQQWRKLGSMELLHYDRQGAKIELNSLSYSPSRARFLRLRVDPDPIRKDEFKVRDVQVLRHIEIPERLRVQTVEFSEREPVRRFRVPGSAWTIDLGGDQIPCSRIELEIADREFARDVQFEVEVLDVLRNRSVFQPLTPAAYQVWQRVPGGKLEPMVANFAEFRARRVRIFVADHRNPPLTIRAVRVAAPVRQVIFSPPRGETSFRLAFGNPDAAMPNYDFARNLPAILPTPPLKITLGEIESNPAFSPPPPPFTERFPWLIYVVLGIVCVVLIAIIVNLSRAAIANHDRQIVSASG